MGWCTLEVSVASFFSVRRVEAAAPRATPSQQWIEQENSQSSRRTRRTEERIMSLRMRKWKELFGAEFPCHLGEEDGGNEGDEDAETGKIKKPDVVGRWTEWHAEEQKARRGTGRPVLLRWGQEVLPPRIGKH